MNQLNSMIRTVYQDLVEKRLWPVALAFALALVAIPLLLSKSAGTEPATTPVAPATPATGSGGPLSAFQPVVTTEGTKSSEIRKSLRGFSAKDPFEVQGLGGGGSASAAAAGGSSDAGSVKVEGSGSSTSGGSSDSGKSGSTTPAPGSTGKQDTGSTTTGLQYFKFTVDVRFGKTDNLDKKRLDQFRALPSSQDPVIVFMGVRSDGETAVFLVSSASSTTGEGNCEPDDTCTFLYMKAGESQTFEAVGGNNEVITYALKILQVNVEKADAPKGASSSKSSRSRSHRARRARSSKASRTKAGAKRRATRRAARARIGAVGF